MSKEKICGIYLIKSPTNKYYVGQSIDIKRRLSDYKAIKNIGSQPKLHRSFIKHGVENHMFSIIELCDENFLNCCERYWQEKYDVVSNGLNCVYVDCGSEKRTGVKKFGKDNPNFGNFWSEEQKRKLSQKKKGIKPSYETILIFKEIRKRGKNSKAKLVLDLQTGIFYDCLKDACESKCLNYHTSKNQVNGTYNNKTSLIYA